ncbi:MAG: NADP oxidoreductase [Chloroflexi bacterium]|nr:NADP oxidoreductase [Chloroflexota bacterium]
MPEKRIVLRNCGVIDPRDMSSYLAHDGFKGLEKALSLTPEQVIEEVKTSGLRGRGGAGFPAGMKWELTRKSPGDEKYLICNADEGEVGTFKDRYILQNDPFSLVEAIAIAGYAIGAKKGFIYLRAEYHYLRPMLANAIDQARAKGFLSHMDIEIRMGAGAYVCGEESALMESIEGKRGEVRYRPPFPPTKGLFGKPTVINNVETLMNIPAIMLNGARWFNQIGTERSKGTKVFSVAGDVPRPGVYEMVLGSKLRELVQDLAGATDIKAIQIGGATGRLIPESMLDTPLAFENLLGAGAITVFNSHRDIIDIVYRTMEFLAEESCGKCVPCRQGTEVMVETLERFMHGEGEERDVKVLQELSSTMMLTSLCGLGQAAPNPVIDSLQYFKDAYESRIKARGEVKV